MRCKHHKKHYEEKRSAHLRNIQTLEANLESKEQELQVSWMNTVLSFCARGKLGSSNLCIPHSTFFCSLGVWFVFFFLVQITIICVNCSFTIFLSCLFHPAVQTSVAKAKKISPERLEVRRTARSLDSEISRLKVKITTQQEQQGDREEVVRYAAKTLCIKSQCNAKHTSCHVTRQTGAHQLMNSYLKSFFQLVVIFLLSRQYHEALENYKNMAQKMKNLNGFIKSLDNVMNHRLQVYAELRR